jgi:hypothetical protein
VRGGGCTREDRKKKGRFNEACMHGGFLGSKDCAPVVAVAHSQSAQPETAISIRKF